MWVPAEHALAPQELDSPGVGGCQPTPQSHRDMALPREVLAAATG